MTSHLLTMFWGGDEWFAVIYGDTDQGAWSRQPPPPGLILNPQLSSILKRDLNVQDDRFESYG